MYSYLLMLTQDVVTSTPGTEQVAKHARRSGICYEYLKQTPTGG